MDHVGDRYDTGVHVQKNEIVRKRIAFFDFDGTITRKDTLLEFIKFAKGTGNFYAGFLLFSPYLVAFKLKIISNQTAKDKILWFFFRNTPVADFEKKCVEFAEKALPALLRPKALREIKDLKEQGVQVVVVSASPENWIMPWISGMNLSLIATKLQVKNSLLTGRIMDSNCHGEEKVNRIRQNYILADYDEILAYGDSSGDRPMLKLASKSFYKPFR
ncbi:MAG: haloacid dehalogenase-like hydrolase [Chitinophagaceae bacterium]|nr:haloacid dehalogenase-like hydrolase [Chitinophagaceae bacterium]